MRNDLTDRSIDFFRPSVCPSPPSIAFLYSFRRAPAPNRRHLAERLRGVTDASRLDGLAICRYGWCPPTETATEIPRGGPAAVRRAAETVIAVKR